mgnify:CR=1 FL=1
MSAQVIAFPGLQLCPCGAGVANLPVPGGLVCADCFEALEVQRAQDLARCASIMLEDPTERDLDSLLERLVRS